MQQLFAVFATVFFAELGDKTQLAVLLFAADGRVSPVCIFAAAAAALVASTAIAVVLGSVADHWLTAVPLRLIAGVGFVLIGVCTIWGYFQQS